MDLNEYIRNEGRDPDRITAEERADLLSKWKLAEGEIVVGRYHADIDATLGRYSAGVSNFPAIMARLNGTARRAKDEGWSIEQTELELIRARRPHIGPGGDLNPMYVPNTASTPEVLQAACLGLMGADELGAKALGEKAAEQGRSLRFRHALDLCEYTLRAAGAEPPRNKNELVKAAFDLDIRAGNSPMSTYSLPTLLGNVANIQLIAAYREAPQTWRAFANIKTAANFQTQTGVRPSGMSNLAKVPRGGEVKYGVISESTYPWSVDTYSRNLGIDRRDIINDSLSAFGENAVAFGRAAARTLNNLVYTTWLNNSSFFTAPNGNLQTGAGSALSATSLGTALAQMIKQTDSSGNPIDITGAFLVVPPELQQSAKQLLQSDFIQLTSTSTGPTGNSLKGALQLVVESRLSNSTYTGNSATGWYLTGSPMDAALIVGFLDGSDTPTIEYFGWNSEPSMLTATWRCTLDMGAALGDYRAAQKSAGV